MKSSLMNRPKPPLPPPVFIWPAWASRLSETELVFFIAGFRKIASAVPKTLAKRLVRKYQTITARPSLPNFFSGRLAAPVTSEKKMIGITAIFSMEIRTVPKGERNPVACSSHSVPSGRASSQEPIPAPIPNRNAAMIR